MNVKRYSTTPLFMAHVVHLSCLNYPSFNIPGFAYSVSNLRMSLLLPLMSPTPINLGRLTGIMANSSGPVDCGNSLPYAVVHQVERYSAPLDGHRFVVLRLVSNA